MTLDLKHCVTYIFCWISFIPWPILESVTIIPWHTINPVCMGSHSKKYMHASINLFYGLTFEMLAVQGQCSAFVFDWRIYILEKRPKICETENIYIHAINHSYPGYLFLTHWGRDVVVAISQTTFSNAFSWKKLFEFRLGFHWSLFLRFELTIFQHWFRQWLGAGQATSHCLYQWWLVYWRIYASLGLNELMWPSKFVSGRDRM